MDSKLVSRQSKRRLMPEENNDFVVYIDEEKEGRKPKGFLHMLKATSMEFCSSTSLHGLQYIGEKQRHVLERIFWLTAFLLSSSIVAYYIYKIWDKWNTSPVLVSFSEVPTPVWNIPFPAVTICPQVKVKQTAFIHSTISRKDNLTAEELEKLQYSRLICSQNLSSQADDNDTVDNRAIEFIEEVAPQLGDVIEECVWRGNLTNCASIFTSVLTDEGLCYTFNTLSSEELFNNDTIQRNSKHLNHSETLNWSLEGGYSDSEAKDTFPRRAMASGAHSGLTMIILQDKIIDPLCSYAIHGVQVLLHNPTDFPNVQDQYFRVPLDRHVIVGIRPRLMVTNKGLRSYEPERRQCYFARERHLRHFSIYTQQNCDFECYTNYTFKTCGCVAYYMPRDQNTRICGPAKQECLTAVSGDFDSDENGLFKCNCMPACTEISYDVETSQAEFSWLDTVKLFYEAEVHNYTKQKLTVVSFYYKERQFVTSRRGELYGPADFLASCGGILGLYLGFSILSVVEIIYFFTVRLFCNFRANKKKHPAP